MASVNKPTTSIFTHQGAKARHISVKQQLERAVMACMLWEDGFYESGISVVERIKTLINENTIDDVVNITLRAKNEMRLRHVPLLLVRELFRNAQARKKSGALLEAIVTRPDDITEFLAVYWKENKDEPLAKQAKLALGKAFHKFNEYALAKYRGNGKTLKLVDALRIVHPEKSELLGKLRRGELITPDTWEVSISAATDKNSAWTRLLSEKKLGGLAMLRNIRNMRNAAVSDALIVEGINAINAGKLLPINFISAAIHNPQFEPYLETKFMECFKKEKVSGTTLLLIDTSYSMNEKLSAKSELRRKDVACSLAMIARETFSDLRVFCFSNTIVECAARKGFALRDLIQQAPSNGTLLGLALQTLKTIPHDRLIVITDEQSQDVVPDFKGYLINIACDKNGVGYGTCVHIDGWSDKVIDYILAYERETISSAPQACSEQPAA